jgi:hypothetical protein
VYVFFCRMSKDFVELLDLAGDDAGERNKVCRQRDDAEETKCAGAAESSFA